MFKMPIGLYEKAPPDELSREEHLATAGRAGYDFVEISIDESDERLSCLDWPISERAALRHAFANTGVKIMMMCLSGHRKYPSGATHLLFANRVWKSCIKPSILQEISDCELSR